MIQVFLTPEESQGYRLAGNSLDSDIPGVIFLVLCAGGIDEASANFLSVRLASAAIRAQQKIKAATRFEIVVAEAEEVTS